MDGKEAVQVSVEETGLSNRSDKGVDPTSEVQLPRSRAKRRQPAVGPAATAAAIAIASTLLGAGKDARSIYAAGETPTPVATATSNLKATETARAQATQVMVGAEARMAAAAATSIARPTQRAVATTQAEETATAYTAKSTATPNFTKNTNDYSIRTGFGLINWDGAFKAIGIVTTGIVALFALNKGLQWVRRKTGEMIGGIFKKSSEVKIDREESGVPGESDPVPPETPPPVTPSSAQPSAPGSSTT